jgi:hypothetical protein
MVAGKRCMRCKRPDLLLLLRQEPAIVRFRPGDVILDDYLRARELLKEPPYRTLIGVGLPAVDLGRPRGTVGGPATGDGALEVRNPQVYFQRKCTKTRPKFLESFSTR